MATQAGATGLDHWGLVVVDMQNDFLAAGGYYARRQDLDAQIAQGTMTVETRNRLLSQPHTAPSGEFAYRDASLPSIVANITTVIAQARAQHRPIAYLQAIYSRAFAVQPPSLWREPQRQHYPCQPHSWGAAFIAPLAHFTMHATGRECVIVKHTFDGFFQTELLAFLRDRAVQTVVLVGVETQVCVLTTAQSAAMQQFHTLILEDGVWTANAALGQGALAIFRGAFGATARCDSIC
jgi:nicotinamidase-related amidase